MSERPRLGKLPPMYNFALNPHSETRVSKCPVCEERMRQRKVPLFIHIDPVHPVVMGYTCRYCPDCDLLVAHQDELDTLLANLFAERAPSLIGNEYMVLGTVERKPWRDSLTEPMSIPEALENLHDFKEVWSFEFRPAGWYRDEQIEVEGRVRAQPREQFKARAGGSPRAKQPAQQRKRRKKRIKKRR